jgi:O-antigen/teichoic acid export membrane protein
MRQRVVSGALWIGVGFGYGQLLRLGCSVALARLLFPHAFGLMALAFTFLTGLMLFSDLGIRTSIVQNPRGDDPAFLDTAWSLQIVRGFLLWGAASLLARPAAEWRPQPEPDLLWLLPLFGLAMVVEGFTSTKVIVLQRHLAQKKAVLLEITVQTVSNGVMVAWAVLDPGVVALASGPVVAAFVKVVLSHAALPGHNNRPRWERAALRDLVHFARWIYVGTALTFLAGNVDKLVVGYRSLAVLGVYHIANQFVAAAVALMAAFSAQLIFPLYSRTLGSGEAFAPRLGRVHLAAGAAGALLLAGVLAAGPSLVRCLYDERYQEARWIMQLLALGAWLQVLEANAGAVLFAKGRPQFSALSNGVKVMCLAAFIPLGLWADGLRGLIIGFVLGDFARYLTTAITLRRNGVNIFPSDFGWTVFVVTIGLGFHFAGDAAFPGAAAGERAVRFLVEGAGVVAAWGIVVLVLRSRGAFRAQAA